MRFVIHGPPRTKKTSQRILRVRNRPIIMQSKQQLAWAQTAVPQLRRQWRNPNKCFSALAMASDPMWHDGPLSVPLNCRALIYRDARRGDAVGYYQAIADALEAAGVVENDRLIVSWDGSRMLHDKANPRVEITLTPMTEEAAEAA